MINGYWENWRPAIYPGSGTTATPSYYVNDIGSMTHVFYAFLCLDHKPDWVNPRELYWDGIAIYETMTQADVMEVMRDVEPVWDNPYEWQKVKIDALQQAVAENSGKFIWSIGGWSDLTHTLHPNQVDTFVQKCVQLLEMSGDGIDLDWEHLSTDPDLSPAQRETFATTLLKLRKSLDAAGLQDKTLGYTTRFNAFWDDSNRPANSTKYASDGEGLSVDKTLKEQGSSLNELVDWVNIMFYDVPPAWVGQPDGLKLDIFQKVLGDFEKHVDKQKLVMGFEPGGQAAGGDWEGVTVDEQVIDYVAESGYGGTQFWAINQAALNSSYSVTGENVHTLAKYAQSKYSPSSCQANEVV